MTSTISNWLKKHVFTSKSKLQVKNPIENYYLYLDDITICSNIEFPKECILYIQSLNILSPFLEDTLTIPENIHFGNISIKGKNQNLKCININTSRECLSVYDNYHYGVAKISLSLDEDVTQLSVNFKENINLRHLTIASETLNFSCNTGINNLFIEPSVKNIKGFNVNSKYINHVYLEKYSGYDLSALSQYNIQCITLHYPKKDTLHNMFLKALKYIYVHGIGGINNFSERSFYNPVTIIDFILSQTDSPEFEYIVKNQKAIFRPPTIHKIIENIISSNQIELFKKFKKPEAKYIPKAYRKTLGID